MKITDTLRPYSVSVSDGNRTSLSDRRPRASASPRHCLRQDLVLGVQMAGGYLADVMRELAVDVVVVGPPKPRSGRARR